MQANLSVIIPVHNVEPYLARCLDSILSQTYQAMDIVLVDDGSTDGSGDICDSYAQRDKRIQVMHQANRGVVNARNTGLRQARAEAPFVTFVDSDDWLEPDTYASMMEVIEREQVVCVLAGHYEDTGSTQRTCLEGMAAGRYDRERMQREFLPQMMGKEPFFTWGIFPSLCNKIFAKRIIVPIMLAEDEHIRMAEDAAAVFLALSCGEPVYVMGKCFYHYVQKRSSSVKMIPPRARERSEYAALQTFMVQHLRTELRGGVDAPRALCDGSTSGCTLSWLVQSAVFVSVSSGSEGFKDYSLWSGDVWSTTLSGIAEYRFHAGSGLERPQCAGSTRVGVAGGSARGYRFYAGRGYCRSHQYWQCQVGGTAGSSTAIPGQTRACVGYGVDILHRDATSVWPVVDAQAILSVAVNYCVTGGVAA